MRDIKYFIYPVRPSLWYSEAQTVHTEDEEDTLEYLNGRVWRFGKNIILRYFFRQKFFLMLFLRRFSKLLNIITKLILLFFKCSPSRAVQLIKIGFIQCILAPKDPKIRFLIGAKKRLCSTSRFASKLLFCLVF